MKTVRITYSNETVEDQMYETYYDAMEKAKCIATWDDVEMVEIYDGDKRLAYCRT